MNLLNRLTALMRKRELENELDEELRFHLEMETAENIRRGMTAEDARYAARRSFGGLQKTQELWRDRRFLPEFEAWWRDLRHAARSLARAPGFTAFAVVSLALGIGANTAIFTVLHALVLRPLPYPEPAGLAAISETAVFQGQPAWMSVSAPNLLDWREQNQVFEDIAAYSSGGVNLSQQNDALHVLAARVEPDVFRILRVAPRLGRVFSRDESEPGRDRVAILSHGLWRTQFGSDSHVVGRRIGVNGAAHIVVGVMPPGFQFPPRTDTALWTPLGFDEHERSARGSHWLNAIARLKPGVSWAAAQSDLDGIARRVAAQDGRTDGASVQPLHGEAVRATAEMLFVLSGAAGFVLLLACANVSHLILARAAGQRRELALRIALGAGRWRIVRLLLAESVAVAALGGVAGLVAARLSLGALLRTAGDQLPPGVPVETGSASLVFCVFAALASAMLAGLIPARIASRIHLTTALKDAASGTGTGSPGRPSFLMVCEVALALALAIGATLLVKSLRNLSEADLGFRPERVLTMKAALPRTHYTTGAQTAAFYGRFVSDLEVVPGVSRVAAATILPVESADNRFVFSIAGREPAAPGREPGALVRIVSPEYFDTVGIPLLRGRHFREDDVQTAGLAAVINRRVAETHFPTQDPVGQRIALGVGDGRDAWMTVVGVVGNHWNGGSYDPVPAMIYTPLRQFERPLGTMSVAVRTSIEPEALAGAARRIARKLDPDAALFQVKTMEKLVSDSAASTRLLSRLLTLFAALALVLAAAGVYGVMSHLVSRRTHEIGVRMALGASRGRVLGQVLARGLWNALAGVLAGVGCTILASGGLRKYVIGVPVVDLWTYLISALTVAAVAVLASFVPAWRASRGDPLAALRNE